MFIRLPQSLLRAAFVVAVIIVFVLTMMPLPAQITVVSNQDKFEHAIAFCVLMLTGWGGWPTRVRRIAAGLVAYGLLIEICQQTLTTNRYGEALDWLADSVGIAIGLGLIRLLATRQRAAC